MNYILIIPIRSSLDVYIIYPVTWSAFYFTYQTLILSSAPSSNPVCVAEECATAHLIPLRILLFPYIFIVSFSDPRCGDYSQAALSFPTIEQLHVLLRLHTLLSKQESLSQKEFLPGVTGLYLLLFSSKKQKGKLTGRKKRGSGAGSWWSTRKERPSGS